MLKRFATTTLVWLTALGTLVAGSPRLACLCADGTRKEICFSHLAAQQPEEEHACCHKSPEQDEGSRPSCCSKKAKQKPAADDGPTFKPVRCQKNLVQPEVAASEKVVVAADVQALIASACVVRAPVVLNISSVLPLPHHGPPPADIVLVLQHLLI